MAATSQPVRWALIIAALGVVFGDIGTSPLYAIKLCFSGDLGIALNADNILGVLSLFFWALTIIVTLQYVFFIMRADNNGEGGILSLLALARRVRFKRKIWRGVLSLTGIYGAAMFYGDGMLSPAISVLSAVEGINVVAPSLGAFTVPAALVILTTLFMVQKGGTAKVGALFGPVMLVWFLVLAVLGLAAIVNVPTVLLAINPMYAAAFFMNNGWGSALILCAVILAVAGGAALYADMGHFGVGPIKRGWLMLVFPALLLNYFGQGALLLQDASAIDNPFYKLAPEWSRWPLLLLATAATITASQAVISGMYSVTRQAIQLGFLPRMKILHTSTKEIGQIYIPFVNWVLWGAIVLLILSFGNATKLAEIYGIAVTSTIIVDCLLACFIAITLWRWPVLAVLALGSLFIGVDMVFVDANLVKLARGAWLPVGTGLVIMLLMYTWRKGRKALADTLAEQSLELRPFIDSLSISTPTEVPGTAVFMTGSLDAVPHALLHNLKHNKVIHARNVFLTLKTMEIPFVPESERIEVTEIAPNFFVIIGRFGFKETPDVPELLEQCLHFGLSFEMMDTTFFLSREHLIPSAHSAMPKVLDWIFAIMNRNAVPATSFFHIPPNRVVELGTQIRI